MLLTWESFGEDVCGVVIGVDIVVLDDTPCAEVAAVVIAHIDVFRTSLGDPGGDVCHEAVLQFLRIQLNRREGETRESLSQIVARCFNRSGYFPQRIIRWEIEWTQTGTISESRRGCFMKSCSWFNAEGVQLAVREWLEEHSGNKTDQITA